LRYAVGVVPRTILHADMDAFYAAIEQRDRPELRGRPVIVGGSALRSVVMTASYEARRFGVHSAMPGVKARRLCPDAVFVPPRMEVYAAVSAQVMELLASFSPLVEPLSLDEAFVDVTGSRALFGDGATIGASIRAAVRERTALAVSIGVATSKFVAKVASDLRKPDALVVVAAGDERAFLAPLPVKRLWGAGPKTQQRLEAIGLRTIGDVQARGEAALVEALGANLGTHFWRLANGIDERAVEPDREAKSVSHEETFERDLVAAADCHAVLLRQAQAVARRLRKDGQRGRVVKLKLRHPPFVTLSRQVTLDSATCDDLTIYRAARSLFERARPDARPVRLLGVGVADLSGGGVAEPRAGNLLAALDAIKDRFGEDSIRHGG
jgi:DNA polymerase-4